MAQPVETTTTFERPTIMNAPWDEHSVLFFKSVGQTVQTGELGHTYKQTHTSTHPHTHKHTDATKHIISPASRSINI